MADIVVNANETIVVSNATWADLLGAYLRENGKNLPDFGAGEGDSVTVEERDGPTGTVTAKPYTNITYKFVISNNESA